jgi:UDP-N-acetyl-D-galactosamine dehydrogenase
MPITQLLKQKDALNSRPSTIIYESTVYPGVTEDEMVPVFERVSGLPFNKDFFCGIFPGAHHSRR